MISSNLWPGGSEPVPPRLAPHQEQAVAWIEQQLGRYTGVILADQTGLGKSWVATTLLRRRLLDGVTIELIVPASLRSMWGEVCARFALDCPIVTHEVIRRSSPPSAPVRGPRFVVVDEAHRFRNPDTKGWDRLARGLVGTRAVFLTATPIWNAPSDLLSLLRLLLSDDGLKHSGVASIEQGLRTPIGRARILDQLVLRRDYDAIPEHLPLGEIRRRTILYEVPSSWVEITRRLEALRFPHCLGYSRSILTQLMIRRLHSSPAALRATLERQCRFCRTGLDLLRNGYRLNRREFARFLVVEDGVQELLFPQLFLEPEDEPDADALQEEIERLDALLAVVAETEAPKSENLLFEISRRPLASLIFVAAVETARELSGHLSAISRCGLATGAHCRSQTGSTSIGALTAEFQRGRLDHLILTDLGGEGLNLQRADRIIHYDLPWSPMRLEQRNGRARRIGREGRPLEVVDFAPRDGELPALATINRKRRVTDEFWTTGDPVAATDRSLERLPSRIVTGHPQIDLWARLDGSAAGDWLLRRYRAGIELQMRDGDPEVIERGKEGALV